MCPLKILLLKSLIPSLIGGGKQVARSKVGSPHDWMSVLIKRDVRCQSVCVCMCVHAQTCWEKATWGHNHISVSVQSLSHVWLCSSMDCSMPGFPVYHQLLELSQIRVHRVSDAIQPSHPLSSPSPPAFNLCQHHSLFKWVSCSHQVAKVLEFQLQDWCWLDYINGWTLGWTAWISMLSKGFSRIFSNTTVQKHQLFGAQLSL